MPGGAVTPVPAGDRKALAYLWARQRIANLSEMTLRPGPAEIAEVTELGLRYNLLTRYTSFIAVHDVVRNFGETAEEVTQPLPLPVGVSNLAVGVGDEPELRLMLAILAAALGCWWILRWITA